jgi:type II secretory pathway pseudopilin PulG
MMTQRTLTGNGRSVAASRAQRAFSMVELLVAMTLLSLIVLVLMAVFSSTQRAFRASVTQTDVLEGGRSTMELIAADLRGMVPSYGVSNFVSANNVSGNHVYYYGGVNFMATNNSPAPTPAGNDYWPLAQSLPAAERGVERTNLLQYFFILGRVNTKWTGTGYYVDCSSANPLYPLYRFYAETNIDANPVTLYWNFMHTVSYSQWTNMSHVMDGVTHLVVRAYDKNGYWLTNGYPQVASTQPAAKRPLNVWFSPPEWGEVGFLFFSNAVPSAVELQLGVLEDRTIQRAESLGANEAPSLNTPQWKYLQAQSGHVQLFRQRVTIPNLDPTAYP